MKRVIFAVLGFLLIYYNTASSQDDNQFHLSLGGTLWNNRWDWYYDSAVCGVDNYNNNHRPQFGFLLKLKYRQWIIGLESLLIKKKSESFFESHYDSSKSKDFSLDLGYSVFQNPYLKPFVKFRISMARFYQISCLHEEDADYRVYALGTGIAAGYIWRTSGFALEGSISQSFAGNGDADYKSVVIRDSFKDHFHTEDVDFVDWYAGISYQMHRYPIKTALGFRKSIDKIKYRTTDRNPEVNCSYTSDFEGPVVMISYELKY